MSETRLDEIKRGLDTIYRFIRKTDEEYLTYLDEIALKHEMLFRDYCITVIEHHLVKKRRRHISAIEIALESFDKIDVQCGFTFNSQLFKVSREDVKAFFIKPLDGDDQFIVKVFDPIKAKRNHKHYRAERRDAYNTCRKAYLCEKLAYEILLNDGLFNNVYVDQKCVFGKFNIGEHYHALGPFIILKYIDPETGEYNRLPKDRRTYEKAEEQLKIIHRCGIIHGDICERNILYSQDKVYFIDFGYSDYNIVGRDSRPVTADPKSTNNEHRKLCRVFNQEIPQQYDTFANNIRRYILRGSEDADIDLDVDTDMDKDAHIDTFEITKLDYRTIFDRATVENLNHVSLMRKFFEVKKHLNRLASK